MSTTGWASADLSAARRRLLSVVVVVAVACGFDVVAEGLSLHLVGVAMLAIAVGAVRMVLRGRLQGLFALVNVAVLAQPAAHALTSVTHSVAAQLPHDHVVPEGLASLALQLAITLLVVLVAASEPLLRALTSSGRGLRLLLRLLLGAPRPPVTTVSPLRILRVPPPREPALTRVRLLRGPPTALAGSHA